MDCNEIKIKDSKLQNRDIVLDNYRGFVIFILTLWTSVFIYQQNLSPLWAIHTDHSFFYGMLSNPVYFSFMDYGLPMFVMASGFAQRLVFNRQKETMTKKQINAHLKNKIFTLLGVAFLFNIINVLPSIKYFASGNSAAVYLRIWNMFASLACSMLVSGLVIKFSTKVRLIVAAFLVAFYALIYCCIPYVPMMVSTFPEFQYGALFGGLFLFGALQIVATVMGEYYYSKQWKKLAAVMGVVSLLGVITIVLSVVNNFANPFETKFGRLFLLDYAHFSIGYIFICGLFDVISFLIIFGITKLLKDREIPLLNTMGKSSIFFFFISCLITFSVELFNFGQNILLGRFLVGLIAIVIMSVIAFILKKTHTIIKI